MLPSRPPLSALGGLDGTAEKVAVSDVDGTGATVIHSLTSFPASTSSGSLSSLFPSFSMSLPSLALLRLYASEGI